MIPVVPERKIPDKIKEELPWGQVPILYMSGGRQIAQSSSIIRYLATKYKLQGDNEYEAAKCDEYTEATRDFINELRGIFSEEDKEKRMEKRKTLHEEYAPKFFERMEKILGENKSGWLVGNRVSSADAYLANWIEIYEVVHRRSDIKSGYKLVNALYQRFFDLPEIKKWREANPHTDPLMTGEQILPD